MNRHDFLNFMGLGALLSVVGFNRQTKHVFLGPDASLDTDNGEGRKMLYPKREFGCPTIYKYRLDGGAPVKVRTDRPFLITGLATDTDRYRKKEGPWGKIKAWEGKI